MYKKILSFDAATKTFAFLFMEINTDLFNEDSELHTRMKFQNKLINGLRKRYADKALTLAECERIRDFMNTTKAMIKSQIHFIDGETVDLVPGKHNSEITPIERIKAFVDYADRRIKPLISPDITVHVEFQMGPNVKSNIIEMAIITYFAKHEIIEINPNIKNNISFPGYTYNLYLQKYDTSYAANKSHCLDNFIFAETLFTSSVPKSTRAMRGHMADCAMQSIAYFAYNT